MNRASNSSFLSSSACSNNKLKPFNPNLGYGKCRHTAEKSLRVFLDFSTNLPQVLVKQSRYCSVENFPSTNA